MSFELPDELFCSIKKLYKMKKILRIGLLIVVLILTVSIWWKYYYVYGEGVKAGSLNFIVKKGLIFKTYEGRLIQDGFKASATGSVQSNEFEFSVANDSLGAILEHNSGKVVELRYKEYLNSLPWRGMSKYVVFEILKTGEDPNLNKLPFQK